MPGYYVFNVDNGFVIVSADTRVEPVLGYSLEGAFDVQNAPDNMMFLLNSYTSEIKAILESAVDDNVTSKKWGNLLSDNNNARKTGTVVVGPLISSTWAQTEFYNQYCPADENGPGGHAYTGCGAVVMGQVMRYWQYPTQGIGSCSYVCNYFAEYGELSADFENTTYDYANMPRKLTAFCSDVEKDAVATLLYHCGVAARMKYGPDYSVINSNNLVGALTTYFGYPSTIVYYEKEYFTGDWDATIKNELDSFAPLLYGGNGNFGGHVFICDGYRDDDFFHINWGWNGVYDGYFQLTEFNPGPYDFNASHAIIMGIRGPELPQSIVANELDAKIYPNPVNDVLNVDLAGCNELVTLKIFDLAGRCVYSAQANGAASCHINVSDLSKGLYVLRVEGKQYFTTQKFVVE